MNNGAVTLVYDGDGNRVAKTVGTTTTRYLADDLNPTGYAQVVEELVGGSVARQYTYGLQRISQMQSGASSFYGYDGGGSVRTLTNAAGTVIDTYDYDAWGNAVNTTGSTPNVYLYRGEQYDGDLNLYYLRARYFNPLTGRFLTRDPAPGSRIDPASLHKYLYTGSDPVNFGDPSGRATAEEEGFLLRVAMVLVAAKDFVLIPVLTNAGTIAMMWGPALAGLAVDLICAWCGAYLVLDLGARAIEGNGEMPTRLEVYCAFVEYMEKFRHH
jgi:RHS repeat-associated protein